MEMFPYFRFYRDKNWHPRWTDNLTDREEYWLPVMDDAWTSAENTWSNVQDGPLSY